MHAIVADAEVAPVAATESFRRAAAALRDASRDADRAREGMVNGGSCYCAICVTGWYSDGLELTHPYIMTDDGYGWKDRSSQARPKGYELRWLRRWILRDGPCQNESSQY